MGHPRRDPRGCPRTAVGLPDRRVRRRRGRGIGGAAESVARARPRGAAAGRRRCSTWARAAGDEPRCRVAGALGSCIAVDERDEMLDSLRALAPLISTSTRSEDAGPTSPPRSRRADVAVCGARRLQRAPTSRRSSPRSPTTPATAWCSSSPRCTRSRRCRRCGVTSGASSGRRADGRRRHRSDPRSARPGRPRRGPTVGAARPGRVSGSHR